MARSFHRCKKSTIEPSVQNGMLNVDGPSSHQCMPYARHHPAVPRSTLWHIRRPQRRSSPYRTIRILSYILAGSVFPDRSMWDICHGLASLMVKYGSAAAPTPRHSGAWNRSAHDSNIGPLQWMHYWCTWLLGHLPHDPQLAIHSLTPIPPISALRPSVGSVRMVS